MTALLEGMTYEQARFMAVMPHPLGRPDFISFPISATLPNVDASFQYVQPQGGTVLPLAASPGLLTVRSSSVEDNPAGTGAAGVRITALDAFYGSDGDPDPNMPWSEIDVFLDGTTIVDINAPTTYMRTLLGQVLAGGSGAPFPATNVGVITFAIGGLDVLIIPAGGSRSRHSAVTIPAGWVGVSDALSFTWTGSQAINMDCALHYLGIRNSGFTGTFASTEKFALPIFAYPATSDLVCTAHITSGSTSTLDQIGEMILIRLPT